MVMQMPTSGVAPLDDDVDPDEPLVDPLEELLQPLEVVEPPDDELHPLEETQPLLEDDDVSPDDELLQPLLLDPLAPLVLDDEEEVCPQSAQGTPRIPTSPPATRATHARPGLHLCVALHS
jgi:hypothetical protein